MPAIEVPSIDDGAERTVQAGEQASLLSEAVAIRSVKRGRFFSSVEPTWFKRSSRSLAQASGVPGIAGASAAPSQREMVDVEATLNIVVENVVPAAASVCALARGAGAMITEDAVEEASTTSAHFTIRVDSGRTDALLAAIEQLGQVRSRLLNARDIGKEYHDTQLLLDNLDASMKRYDEILRTASQVSDVLAVEKEIIGRSAHMAVQPALGVNVAF